MLHNPPGWAETRQKGAAGQCAATLATAPCSLTVQSKNSPIIAVIGRMSIATLGCKSLSHKELRQTGPRPLCKSLHSNTLRKNPTKCIHALASLLAWRGLRQVEERANSKPALYVDGQDLCITCNVSGTDMSTPVRGFPTLYHP